MRRRHWLWGLLATTLWMGCGGGQSATEGGGGSGAATAVGGGGAGGDGGSGGQTPDPRFDPLLQAIEAERVELGAPGVAFAVIEDGKVSLAAGLGSKDPSASVPVKATTLFRTGSVNKMLTTAALLQGVAENKVDLSAPVTTYVPEFHFNADPAWAPSITVEHLLTHSSGINDYLKIDVAPGQQLDSSLEVFMTGTFANVGYLMAPAGAFYNYSNPNFYMAGLIGEKVSGKLYRDMMRENVFAPLGMDRTYFLASEVLADGDYAIGATSYPGVPNPVLPDTYENAWARPAGYATSNVLDLAKFVGFLLDGNEEVLPKALSDEMQKAHVSTEELGDLVNYGYGLEVLNGGFLGGPDKFYAIKVVQHGGAIPGFSALVTYVPEHRFGFITMANTDGAYFINSLVTALTTLVELPAPSTPPDFTVDPATFVDFEGEYQDDFNVGQILVTKVGDTLEVSMPAVDQANIPYDKVLVPTAPNNFVLKIQGAQLPVTFLPDEGGVTRYFRTRAFVGIRPDAPPPAPPPSAPSKVISAATREALIMALRSAPPPRLSDPSR